MALSSLRDVEDLVWPPADERERSYQVLLDDALANEDGTSCAELAGMFDDYNLTAFSLAFARTAMGRWLRESGLPFEARPTAPWGGNEVLLTLQSVAHHLAFKAHWPVGADEKILVLG